MTENSTSDVGCATINAYLDSVEEALLAANAPRGDRVQVLADLESQMADMLAQHPAPLREEAVKSAIEKLTPPVTLQPCMEIANSHVRIGRERWCTHCSTRFAGRA